MTRDDIIRMAREAGLVPHYTRPQDAIVRKGYALSGELKGYKAGMLDIERFFHAAYAAGAKAEQDRCCKIVYGMAGSDNVAQRTVDAIRGKE